MNTLFILSEYFLVDLFNITQTISSVNIPSFNKCKNFMRDAIACYLLQNLHLACIIGARVIFSASHFDANHLADQSFSTGFVGYTDTNYVLSVVAQRFCL